MHGPGCAKAWGEQDHLRLPPGLHSLPNLVLQITLGFYWGQSQPWPIRAPAIEPTLLWKTQNGKQSASLKGVWVGSPGSAVTMGPGIVELNLCSPGHHQKQYDFWGT